MKLSVSPVVTVLPSLCHVIFGVGLPMALQRNVPFSPSTIVWSRGVVVKLRGSVTVDIKMFLKKSGFHFSVNKYSRFCINYSTRLAEKTRATFSTNHNQNQTQP